MYPRLQHPTEHSYENGRRRNPTAVSCVVERGAIWQNTPTSIKYGVAPRRSLIIIEVHDDVQVIAQ